MRVRIAFSKTEAMRYTSHLDLHRTWERTLRRAGLALAYSQGFKPHPRINIGCALPLGFTSQAELLDVYFEDSLSTQQITEHLNAAVPPGIQINSVEDIPTAAPVLQSEITAAEYVITVLEPIGNLDERVAGLLNADTLPRERQAKPYDLRPLILELARLPDDSDNNPRLSALLSAREGATGRPEEVLLALGASPDKARVHRTRLLISNSLG